MADRVKIIVLNKIVIIAFEPMCVGAPVGSTHIAHTFTFRGRFMSLMEKSSKHTLATYLILLHLFLNFGSDFMI